jgi:hypothetical protein
MSTRKNRGGNNRKTQKIRATMNSAIYTQKDYESNDGMLTAVWGPGMWHYLHTMSFNYPVHPSTADKKHYRDFILQLQFVLPCGKCRKNLKRNFHRLPLKWKHMENRESFSKYIYQLHELVNRMLHKNSGLTYEMVRERYEHFRARCALPYKMLNSSANRTRKQTPNRQEADERGCTVPLYGEKSKCVIKIVPDSTKCKTLNIDKRCMKQKLTV